MTREDIQDPDHVQGGGEPHHLLDTGGQGVDQEDVPIQSREAGDDLKVLGDGGLIPESAEGLGACPNPETKRKKKKRKNGLKHHQRVTAQPGDLEAQAEKDGAEEAEVDPDHLKNPDPLRESYPDLHHQRDTKRRRKKIKKKKELEMNERGQQARKRRARTKKRTEKENQKVTRMSKSQEITMKKNKAMTVRKRKRRKGQEILHHPNIRSHHLKKGVEMQQGSPKLMGMITMKKIWI